MSMKSARAAEALFRKQDQQAALSEYEQRRNAEQAKSAKLRALRLAKEAADKEAAAAISAAARKIVARKTASKKTATKKPAAKVRKTSAAIDTAND